LWLHDNGAGNKEANNSADDADDVEGLELTGLVLDQGWHDKTSASTHHPSEREVDKTSGDLEDWDGTQVSGAGVLVLALVLVPEFDGNASTDLHDDGSPSQRKLPEFSH